MTTVVRLSASKYRVFVKGGPEILLPLCETQLSAKGETVSMEEADKNKIENEVVRNFAAKCYRTILVAYKDFTAQEWEDLRVKNSDFKSTDDRASVEVDLTMIGVFGLQDPLRPGIPDAVERCRLSGINVRMVTGDHIDTALAIARQAGIVT